MKVGGSGRSEVIARIISERADKALRQENIERKSLTELVAEKERSILDLRSALALLNLAMDQIRSTTWATDENLVIRIVANGELPSTHCGVVWEAGKTIYEIFKTEDPLDLGVAAHLEGLKGIETSVRLLGEFSNMTLRVVPLRDEANEVMGCIGVLNIVGD